MVRMGRIPSFSFPKMGARLPDHYYKHLQELKKPSTRVHDRAPKTQLLNLSYNPEIHKPEPVPDLPIPIMYPSEADQGLWGGEGIAKGYVKPRKYFQSGWPRPKMWFPTLKKVVLHSEILDKHFTFVVTERTLELVDQHNGLDSYILRTPIRDLKSQLGLLLRRKMLLTLIRDEFKTPEIAKEMKEKYSDCIIPEEEADWIGLTKAQAFTKLKIQNAIDNPKIPLKYEFAKKLIADLEYKKNNPDPTPEPEKKGVVGKLRSKLGI